MNVYNKADIKTARAKEIIKSYLPQPDSSESIVAGAGRILPGPLQKESLKGEETLQNWFLKQLEPQRLCRSE